VGYGFKVSPWAKYTTYTLNMSEHVLWRDKIQQLWVVPLWGEGNIEIDYIRLLSSESAPATPTPIQMGGWRKTEMAFTPTTE
jgi:hypothetical protein